MREIEIKIINMNVNILRRKIIALGAKRIFIGDVSSLVLDFQDLRISKKDSLLRLRSFDNKTHELTFKGPHKEGKYKVRRELSVRVSEYKDLLLLLKEIGLKPSKKIYKFRESYELMIKRGKKKALYHIDIDDYKIIPEFMEIEAKNVSDLTYLLKVLKIPKNKIFNGSTPAIFNYYDVKQNL